LKTSTHKAAYIVLKKDNFANESIALTYLTLNLIKYKIKRVATTA
jgi:hypothetical protein